MPRSPAPSLRAALLALAGVFAGAGCLDARFAGPARRVAFATADGKVSARLPPLPRALTPVERETYAALRKEAEAPDRILRATLLAGGVTDEEALKEYEARARADFEALRPALEKEPDPKERARALLRAIHGRTLRAYAVDQTYLHVIYDTGVFNCLSSVVLYNIYAGWLGLRSGISLLPSHARGWIDAGEHRYEVETTDPNGFEPKRTPLEERAFLQLRALGGEQREQPSFRPNREAVGMIIANRIAFGHDGPDANTTSEALRAARVIVALGLRAELANPNEPWSWYNQVSRLDRLAIFLIGQNRFEEGIPLQHVVVDLAGDHGAEAERVRNNVLWAAERRILVAGKDRALITRAVLDGKHMLDCERRMAMCKKLEAFAEARLPKPAGNKVNGFE